MKMKSIFICLVSAVCLQTAFGANQQRSASEIEKELRARIDTEIADLKKQSESDRIKHVYQLDPHSLTYQITVQGLWGKEGKKMLLREKEAAEKFFNGHIEKTQERIAFNDLSIASLLTDKTCKHGNGDSIFLLNLEKLLTHNPTIKTLRLTLTKQMDSCYIGENSDRSSKTDLALSDIRRLLYMNKTLESLVLSLETENADAGMTTIVLLRILVQDQDDGHLKTLDVSLRGYKTLTKGTLKILQQSKIPEITIRTNEAISMSDMFEITRQILAPNDERSFQKLTIYSRICDDNTPQNGGNIMSLLDGRFVWNRYLDAPQ